MVYLCGKIIQIFKNKCGLWDSKRSINSEESEESKVSFHYLNCLILYECIKINIAKEMSKSQSVIFSRYY